MQLQVGDKFSGESGEWELIAHRYATAGGRARTCVFSEWTTLGWVRRGRGSLTRRSRWSGEHPSRRAN